VVDELCRNLLKKTLIFENRNEKRRIGSPTGRPEKRGHFIMMFFRVYLRGDFLWIRKDNLFTPILEAICLKFEEGWLYRQLRKHFSSLEKEKNMN
jgi:hypothetical protein